MQAQKSEVERARWWVKWAFTDQEIRRYLKEKPAVLVDFGRDMVTGRMFEVIGRREAGSVRPLGWKRGFATRACQEVHCKLDELTLLDCLREGVGEEILA